MAKKSAGRKSTKGPKGKSARGGASGASRSTTKRRTTAAAKSPRGKTTSRSGRAAGAKISARPAAGKKVGATRRAAGAKVGNSRRAAAEFAQRGDFGISASNQPVARGASEKAKRRPAGNRDREDRQPRAGVESREAGVGAREGGAGAGSGGDLDTDVVGLPDARGLAQSGPDDEENIRAAETTGGSEEFASGPPARGENQPARGREQIRGTTHDRSGGDATTTDTSAPGTVGHTQATEAGAGHANIADWDDESEV